MSVTITLLRYRFLENVHNGNNTANFSYGNITILYQQTDRLNVSFITKDQ